MKRGYALGPELNAEGRAGGGSDGFRLCGGASAERPDEPACLVAVEHHGRGLAVPEGAEPDERRLAGGAHVRAVLVAVDDERRAEFRSERREKAASPRASLERHPVPAATGVSDRRAAVGQTAQAAKTEPCSGRQVVQAEAEPHQPGDP